MSRLLYASRSGPDAAAHPQAIPYACCTLLPIAVCTMNINELMNINDVGPVHHNITTTLQVDM